MFSANDATPFIGKKGIGMYAIGSESICSFKRSRKARAANLIFACMLLCMTSACVSLKQYRSEITPCALGSSAAGLAKCPTESDDYPNAIEVANDFTLGFVEFDDQGWLYGPKGRELMRTVMKKLVDEAASATEITLVVFVHGWKHNAQSSDPNVQAFRGMLSNIKAGDPARKVFGIYVGWRGLAVDGPDLIRSSTLIDRKFTAEHVAKGSVRELFARIQHFQLNYSKKDKENDLVSVVIGHSFGGLIVYNAMSQVLLNNAVDPDQDDGKTKPKIVDPFFDITLLINPAFEASRYEPLHQVAQCRKFADGQKPVFMSLTSENDSATGFLFHAYRRVVTTFSKYVDPTQTNADKQTKAGAMVSQKDYEEEADRNTVGYVERYRTHSLYFDDGAAPAPPENLNEFMCANVCSSGAAASLIRPTPNAAIKIKTGDGHVMTLNHEPRESCDPNNPFWVVKVDKRIIDGHNGFYSQDPDKNYLTEFVAYQVNQKTKERKVAPKRLSKQMQ